MNVPAEQTPEPSPGWTAEREITPGAARQLIREAFAQLAGIELEEFAQGWDNTALRARTGTAGAGDVIFRFPRRAIALAGIRREVAWLPQLAPLLPLPVPVPAFVGLWSPASDSPDSDSPASEEEPWPFWGAALLPGSELAMAAPALEQRLEPAGQLGAFLRVLHTLPPDGFTIAGDAKLPLDPLGRANPAQRLAKTAACLDRLRECGLPAPFDAASDLINRAAELASPGRRAVICHGDLHARHILVGQGDAPAAASPQVTGIIDWGDLCLADPAVDLSIAFGAFSGPSRQAFFDAYGPIDADRELRARALAVSLNALLSEYAIAHVGAAGSVSALLPEVCDALARAVAD